MYYSYREQVVYVKAQKSMNAKLFYSSIYNKMVGESYNPKLSTHFIIRKTANKFNESNTNKLLIIDEAGKFTQLMLEYLHEFRDETQGTTGIVLVGPEYFAHNMETWNNKMVDGMPEVYSRISHWVELKAPTFNEKVALANAYGIFDKVFINYLKKANDFRLIKNLILNYQATHSKNNTIEKSNSTLKNKKKKK
jgi:hypothetical protein